MAIKFRNPTVYGQFFTRRPSTYNFALERQWRGTVIWSITFILIIVCNNISGFSPKQVIMQPYKIPTTRYFRHPTAERIEPMLSVNTRISSAANDAMNEKLPIWHRRSEDISAEQKLVTLRDAMEEFSLTPREAKVVESAIIYAAGGDLNKIAGVVDFCHIILETMEMDISVLVAASFHYCSCYDSKLLSEDECPKLNLKLYLPETVSIVNSAAQLKEIEDNYAAIDTLNSRNSGNLRRLLLTRTNNWSALAIRSAASLHRLRGIIRNCIDSNHEIIGDTEMRAARQAVHIYAPLASRLGMHRLKSEIESAAFPILYRRQFEAFNEMMCKPKRIVPGYHAVSSHYKELESFTCLKDEMEEILAHATDKITRILSEDYTFTNHVDNFTVTARVKESYSLWRKALKLGAKSIQDVPDAIALRVIVDSKNMVVPESDEVTQARDRLVCYLAHLICSNSFKPLEDSKFKNYIARPKPNGYQSLHYTTCTEFQNEIHPLEIQIRSREMHQVAEFGVAAHWNYKTNKSGNSNNAHKFKFDHSTDAYLSACGDWHFQHAQNNANPLMTDSRSIDSSANRKQDDNCAPFIEALEVTKSMLTTQRVYIFLAAEQPSQKTGSMHRNGKLLELPAGACVLDALRESKYALGFSTNLCEQSLADILHNDGALTSLTQKLKNGDIITIPASAQRNIYDYQLAEPLRR